MLRFRNECKKGMFEVLGKLHMGEEMVSNRQELFSNKVSGVSEEFGHKSINSL